MWKRLNSIYFFVSLFSFFYSLIGYPEILDKWIKYLGIKTDIKTVIDQNMIRWIAFAVGMILIGIWSGAYKKGWQKLRRPKRDLSTGAAPIENDITTEREPIVDETKSAELKVIFKQGKLPWVREQRGDLNGQDYIFRIELMNLGSETIHNPRVRLVEIKPDSRDEITVPCDLQVKNKDIPKTDKEGEGEFVDVLKYFRHVEHKDGIDRLWMIGSIENRGYKIPVQEYKIKIIVSGNNSGEPIAKHFKFNPKKRNPKLCMETIEPIRSEKALELEKWINKYITIEPDLSHNPNAIMKHPFVSKLLGINNFCATYRLQNGKPYSVPLEKILLSWDDENECLKLIIKP